MTHAAWAAVSAHAATTHEVALHGTAEQAALRNHAAQHEAIEAHSPGKPHHPYHVRNYGPDRGPYALDRVTHWELCSNSFRSDPNVEAGCGRSSKAPVNPTTGMPTG
jgi:hypothetical protein